VRSSDERPTNGRRSELTRSPRSPSSAGRSVSAATTETTPTRIAPSARLRITLLGTINIPHIATTNAVPLTSTARLAGRTGAADRVELLASDPAFFSITGNDEQRVVDPSASPMPVSMLKMNTDRWNGCENTATSPSATMIEMIAISRGTSPATIAPNTRIRMTSAAGSRTAARPTSDRAGRAR
jgi:hypothetical protein